MTRPVLSSSTLRRPWRRFRRWCRVIQGRDVWCRRELTLATERHGTDYGGWTLWPAPLSAESVVYSFGVGQDVSFDLSLIRRFGCRVHAFDPTPRSVTWVHRQEFPPEFCFHDYGLGHVDGLVAMSPPVDPAHVSYSTVGPGAAADRLESFPVKRLRTIAAELGHERVDLLKMDIEGAEYEALADWAATGLPVGQILVEFHHRRGRDELERTRQTLAQLRARDYLLFDVSPTGEEYAFVHQAELQRAGRRSNEYCPNVQ